MLSEAELGTLWNLLDDEAAPFGPAIKLLILTGQRRGEVFDADRSEFDLEAKLWTIPRSRAKNGVAHLVPLSEEALTIIKSLTARDDSDKLFPARGNGANGPSGFSKTMNRVGEAMVRSVATMDQIVERGRTARKQGDNLLYAAIGGVLIAFLLLLALVGVERLLFPDHPG